MATIHVSRSGATLGTFEEEKVREGLRTGEFIGTDLGWMEGMATWRPLSELDDFRAAPPAAAAVPAAAPISPAVVATSSDRAGLPWENREKIGWFNALVETIQLVLMKPAEAFAIMRREGGLMDPLLYAVILGMVGAVVSFFFSMGMHAFGIGSRNGLAAMFGAGAVSVVWLIFMPVIIVCSIFIFSGLIHLVLMLLGGAKQPFEATVRVVSYASGSANILQIIPICGGLIAMIYSIVLNCMGQAQVHETDTGRAVVAVLSPVLLCCGGVFFFAMMAGGLAALSSH